MRATFLQNGGIGRGMKVGKESVVATMAALEAWGRRDHQAIRAKERGYLERWVAKFSGQPGIKAEIIPDPTGNPIDRLKLSVDPDRAGTTAWDLADALAGGDPPVIIRDHEVELGFFELDPCNLHPGEAEVVAERVAEELTAARARNDRPSQTAAEWRQGRFRRLLNWPD